MHIPFLEKNTLECRLKAARAELGAFKSGKKYQDMQEMHRKEVQALECGSGIWKKGWPRPAGT